MLERRVGSASYRALPQLESRELDYSESGVRRWMSRRGGELTPGWVALDSVEKQSGMGIGTCDVQVGALSSNVDLLSRFLTQFPDP